MIRRARWAWHRGPQRSAPNRRAPTRKAALLRQGPPWAWLYSVGSSLQLAMRKLAGRPKGHHAVGWTGRRSSPRQEGSHSTPLDRESKRLRYGVHDCNQTARTAAHNQGPKLADRLSTAVSRQSRVDTYPVASSQLETHALASPRRGLGGGQGGTVPGPGGMSG